MADTDRCTLTSDLSEATGSPNVLKCLVVHIPSVELNGLRQARLDENV